MEFLPLGNAKKVEALKLQNKVYNEINGTKLKYVDPKEASMH